MKTNPKNARNCKAIERLPLANPRPAEQPGVEQGFTSRELPQHEADQRDRADDEAPRRPSGPTSPGAGPRSWRRSRPTDRRPTTRHRSDRSTRRARHATRAPTRGEHEGAGRPDRVGDEHPFPRGELEQGARQQQPDHGATAGDAGPRAHGPRPLLRREAGRDDRQRRRHHERGADACDRPVGDQHAGVGGERRERVGDTEHQHPGDEHPTPAEPVAERAGRQEQTGEDDGVPVDEPL